MAMRFGIWIALSFFISASALAKNWHEVYRSVGASVIRVHASGSNRQISAGSGIVVGKDRVVTNCHVTQDATSIDVVAGSLQRQASNEAAFPSRDLCILSVPNLDLSPAKPGRSRDLHIGDPVFAVGFGGGLRRTMTAGTVTGLYEHDGALVIRTSAAFRPGASGGGLFDRDGNLVGLTTFYRITPKDAAFFAIPAEWIEAQAQMPAVEDRRPFWLLPHAQQPRFLQVATLESEGRWEEMREAALRWTEECPGENAAWSALGEALMNSGLVEQAQEALRRAAETALPKQAALK